MEGNHKFICDDCKKEYDLLPFGGECTCRGIVVAKDQIYRFGHLWEKIASECDYVQPCCDDFLEDILANGRYFGCSVQADEYELGNCHTDCVNMFTNDFHEGDRLCTGYALTNIGYIQHTWLFNKEDQVVEASTKFYATEHFGIILEGNKLKEFIETYQQN